MDWQLLSVTLMGFISTVVAAIVGPHILERYRRRLDEQRRREAAQQGPYAAFSQAVERMQLDIDLMSSGYNIDHSDYVAHFRSMEESRSQIDVVGSQSCRVWAYRCRLAITSLDRASDSRESHEYFRLKLHEARSQFITFARAELGIVRDGQPLPVHQSEDSSAGHSKWLQRKIDEKDMREAIKVAASEFGTWSKKFEKPLAVEDLQLSEDVNDV